MVDAGNRVVFDKDSNGKCISCLESKSTKVRTAIHERSGTYQFDIKVPRGRGGGVEQAGERLCLARIRNDASCDAVVTCVTTHRVYYEWNRVAACGLTQIV